MSLRPRLVDFDTTWGQLLETVRCVIKCDRINRAIWNDRFSDVYVLCVANPEPFGDELYAKTKTFLESHVNALYKQVIEAGEENLLCVYHKNWLMYSTGATYLNQLYRFLNTQFIKKQKHNDADMNYGCFGLDFHEQLLEIGELALDSWKRLMIEPLKSSLQSLLLQEIHKDRCDETVQLNVLHGTINSLVDVDNYKLKAPLKLYEDYFENTFLRDTGKYYRQEALKMLDVSNCSTYMVKVIQRLDEENMRSRKFLHPSSYSKVSHECEQRLMADHLSFLHLHCRHMVTNECLQDLSNMYQLLSPIHNGLGILVSEVQQHITAVGLETVKTLKGENMATQFVESILEVHAHNTELIRSVFDEDKQFVGALDKACATAINYKPNPKSVCKFPELLAKYCDSMLKKSAKGISESEIDDKLAKSITVFKYLDDKDIFQRFYARMLAKRLIYFQSQSMDAEEAMINRLKQACGYDFTNKLHRMFTDMSISGDLNAKFDEFIKKNCENSLQVNFSMLVLQAGAWPIGQTNLPTFAIPQQLEKSVRMFELFYSQNFNGRKLTWMHSFCNAELRFTYLKKPYFVTMSTFHMAILLPFNASDHLTLRDLQETTQLPEKELGKQIQALLDTKIISTVESENSTFNENTVFELNMNYNNKRTKFKIVAAAQKETNKEEVETTHTAVQDDRKMYLQAGIVRIMKARKLLKHNLLIQEVISQSRSRFTPSISMIKKCIESLIDKQYVERTSTSSDEYSYVA